MDVKQNESIDPCLRMYLWWSLYTWYTLYTLYTLYSHARWSYRTRFRSLLLCSLSVDRSYLTLRQVSVREPLQKISDF